MLASLVVWFGRNALIRASIRLPPEFPAAVGVVEQTGEGFLAVQKDSVVEREGGSGAFVFCLQRLRARKVDVLPVGSSGNKVIVKSGILAPGDLVLIEPGSIQDGAAVSVTDGLDEKRLVQLTLVAAVTAVNQASLAESVRFVSPGYADPLGFDFRLMSGFLSKAYKEFSYPLLEVVGPFDIEIRGTEAVVKGSIRLQGTYHGRRSYLLGGSDFTNAVWMRMEKSRNGWKLVELRGLRPLGFDEKIMKLLGAEVGMSLSTQEKQEKKEFCMPCRSRMAERFGNY